MVSKTDNDKDLIGVFDSGLGGLTVLQKIVKKVPNADIIYFGDTKHAPYGDRSQAELGALTANAFSFLRGMGVTKIVTACNSISTLLMGDFLKTCNLDDEHVIEMSKPVSKEIAGKYKRVLILATSATVKSHMHRDALAQYGVYAYEMPISGLVDLIEQGAKNTELEDHIMGNIGSLDVSKYDAVLLGCTHFPFALKAFRNVLGSEIDIIDPANAVAKLVAEEAGHYIGTGHLRFYTSKESKTFNKKVAKMFGDEHKITVV